MKDPEDGRPAADNGASGDNGGTTDRPQSPRDGKKRRRRPRRRNAAAQQTDARTPDAAPDGADSPKRKRKRRRGRRKPFVRDGEARAQAGAPAEPADSGAGAATEQDRPRVEAAPRPRGPASHHHANTAARSASGLRHAHGLPAAHRVKPVEGPVYAALDLGTNNCRLLMATPTRPGQFRVVDAFSRIVRLGEGLSASGRLSDAAMDRAIEALQVCAAKLKARRVRRARLIATEACRSATNGAAFIERVRCETGLKLEVVNRETEARLAVSGCGTLVERDTPGAVLFDIGGGSSEIALIDIPGRRSPHLAHHIVSWTSLPVGVVSLAERFGGREVTRDIFEAMVQDVSVMIAGFDGRDRLSHLAGDTRFHLLGTSGTVTTLAGIFLELERYDRRRIDGIWLDSGDVSAMTERLLGWDFATRMANPCIGADRADLVLAGCAILEAIRRAWPSDRLRVADRGLREGILTELMARDGVWRRRGRPRQGGN
ncbi:exopolyphosphatase [Zhengella mangrovi]|uniref:Exopolyphosphatase n=1 Tax=Zhengella mangrovi TaxID=1982044 RepID=A0A2G1QMK7_9HYPH|nr:Ppx/GppA phosphatase family protein [Zhengella mangrovi]PHP66743.1 exopolyphosphatase [Zhengella mangrovi]